MRKFLSIIFLFSVCSTILHGCDSGSAPAGEDSNTDTGNTSSPDLYVENTGGYRQFRIPAVVLTSDGTLLALGRGPGAEHRSQIHHGLVVAARIRTAY